MDEIACGNKNADVDVEDVDVDGVEDKEEVSLSL
jgi:hypothetical protein